jgi:hypothetical protein
MRKGLLALTLLLVVGFTVWKVVPFLQGGRPDVYDTPTAIPLDGVGTPVTMKKGQEACLTGLDLGPDARYTQFSLQTKRPSPPLQLTVKGPGGYVARAPVAGGQPDNTVVITKITPAPRELSGGRFCLRNLGRHAVSVYGVGHGARSSAPNVTTVDGKPVDGTISLTLLRSPSRSLWAQLGETFDRMAAFRPVTGFEVWILALLVLLATPVGLAVALARSAATDDAAADAERQSQFPPDRGGW